MLLVTVPARGQEPQAPLEDGVGTAEAADTSGGESRVERKSVQKIEEGRVEVTIQTSMPTVGDRISLVLTVEIPPGDLLDAPRFPTWTDDWSPLEILEVGEVEGPESLPNGHRRFRQRLVATSFRAGNFELPRRTVALPFADGTATWGTQPVDLTVVSVLPATTGEGGEGGKAGEDAGANLEPAPPAPPRRLGWGLAFWLTAAGLGLLAAFLAWRLHRRGEDAAAVGPERFISPWERLDLDLKTGFGDDLVEAHTALSLALRRYLGSRLGFPAVESTTTEIRRQLRSRHAPFEVSARSVDLLMALDGVKFAHTPADFTLLAERTAAARQIGEALESYLRPASAPDNENRQTGSTAPGPPLPPVSPMVSSSPISSTPSEPVSPSSTTGRSSQEWS